MDIDHLHALRDASSSDVSSHYGLDDRGILRYGI